MSQNQAFAEATLTTPSLPVFGHHDQSTYFRYNPVVVSVKTKLELNGQVGLCEDLGVDHRFLGHGGVSEPAERVR